MRKKFVIFVTVIIVAWFAYFFHLRALPEASNQNNLQVVAVSLSESTKYQRGRPSNVINGAGYSGANLQAYVVGTVSGFNL